MARAPENLEQLLDSIADAAHQRDRITLQRVVEAVGRRSFGPLLLMVGVVTASPLSGIPGVPTLLGLLILLVAVQLLIGRRYFWLPRWLLRRWVPNRKLTKALGKMRPAARFVDALLRPRLTVLVRHRGTTAIALVCVIVTAAMPLLELVPFSASLAGVALAAFGLALVARDGAAALIGYFVTAVLSGLMAYAIA